MKNFKKIIAIFLCLSIFFNSITNYSLAKSKKYSSNTKNNIKYVTTENELINTIKKEITSQKSKIVIPVDYTKLNIDKISNALNKAQLQPEILSIKEDWNSVSAPIINGKYNLTLNVSYFKGAKNLSAMINKWIKENISNDMNEEEKIRAIHDYIVLKTAYNYGDSNSKVNGYCVHSPVALLNEGAGVCQGYALLFYEMAKKAGLNVLYISAEVHKSSSGHAWNMVNVDGNFYHIDVTWDDPIPDKDGRILYDYYLRGDEFMSKTHKWDKNKFPKAKSDYTDSKVRMDIEELHKDIDLYYGYSNISSNNKNNDYIDNSNLEKKSNYIKDYGYINYDNSYNAEDNVNYSYLSSKSNNKDDYCYIEDAPLAKTTELVGEYYEYYENYDINNIPKDIPYPITYDDNYSLESPIYGTVDFSVD